MTKIKINPFLLVITLVYVVLAIITLNNCYFWDVIQQVSKEGHWFYETNFSSLLVLENNFLNVSATGYHPPLMGTMTALLWKIFGQHLWASHAFTAFWAILLIYNSWKLVLRIFPKKYVGWIFLILLLEPTVLGQFVISSPDFILFTAFVIAFRAVLERKPIALAIGIFFLCCINMRGLFVGVMLFFVNVYFDYLQNEKKISIKSFFTTLVPYLPTLAVLLAYFIFYFSQKGWFFADSDADGHYAMPQSWWIIVRQFLSFGLRLLEYGRVAIWVLALYFFYVLIKKKTKLSSVEKTLLLFVVLMNGLYFLFIFISQMPFAPRYFMPQFFILAILVLMFVVKYFDAKQIKITIGAVLFFTLSGHFWIYPEKIAQPWESTLMHLPYYELRTELFNYIDESDYDYGDLTAGFSIYGNRGFVELSHYGKIVRGTDMSSCYFIYSNVSNLEDEYIIALQNKENWQPIKHFKKGVIFFTIYENLNYDKNIEQ